MVSQKPYKEFYKDSTEFYLSKNNYLANKIIPIEFKDAIHIALNFYPNLKATQIKFKIKKNKSPLTARPTIWAIFQKASKRKYIITLSNKTNLKLTPILFQNLSFNAQIGVIGHELAHIDFYNTKKGIYFIKLALLHLSKKSMDKFEFNTDKRCIESGLGYQLLNWSKEVREKLKLKQWGGSSMPTAKKERYMNPETILKHIKNNPLYNLN